MSEKLTVGSTIPNFTLKDSDKNDLIIIAKKLIKLGFKLVGSKQ